MAEYQFQGRPWFEPKIERKKNNPNENYVSNDTIESVAVGIPNQYTKFMREHNASLMHLQHTRKSV